MLGICFELLVAPIKPELAVVTVLRANADASTCTAGTQWSDAANRCLVKESVAQTQRDLQACADKTGEEQTKCFEDNARKASGNSSVSNVQDLYNVTDQMRGMGAMKTAAYALPLILFTYLIIKSKKSNKGKRCMPPSTIALIAGAVASGGGEVYGWIKHGSNINKLNEARAKISNGKEATTNADQKKVNVTELQSEAFQLLADEQKSVADLAKTKKIFYGAATVAYAAAAGIAAYELFTLKAAGKAVDAAQKAEKAAADASAAAAKLAALTASEAVSAAQKRKDIALEKFKAISDLNQAKPSPDGDSKYKIADAELKAADQALAAALQAQFVEIATAMGIAARAAAAAAAKTAADAHKAASNATIVATNKQKALQQKFVCGGAAEGKPVRASLPKEMIQKKIDQIKNSDSIDEVHAIADSISNESGFNTYSPTASLVKIKTAEDKTFLKLYAEIVASEIQDDYGISSPHSSSLLSDILSKIKNNLLIPSAHAESKAATFIPVVGGLAMLAGPSLLKGMKGKAAGPENTANPNATATANPEQAIEASPELQKHDSKTNEFLHSPKFRIIFGGVLGGLTTFMTVDMGKLQKLAEDREKKLLELKADFQNTQGMKICTPAERNDQSQPGCYCYTSEGSRNNARASSAICQNMWNSIALNNNSYLSSTDTGPKVCITQSSQVDQSCSCRTSNTCMKASGFGISGINLGTLSTLNNGLSPVNAVASGNGASLNTDANLNSAFKLREATEKLLSTPELKDEKKGLDAASKNLEKFIQTNQGTLSAPSSRSVPSSLANFDAKAALEDLKEEVETSFGAQVPSSGIGFDTGSSEPTLEFGLTEEEAAVQEQQVAEVLQQDMDLGSNDISSSSTNLFEVLSHRYQRSGMRRLFDTEGKTEADKPAETDINK